MKNFIKMFLIICACVAIFYFTVSTIIFIGTLTIVFLLVKYCIYKLKHKLGDIFN